MTSDTHDTALTPFLSSSSSSSSSSSPTYPDDHRISMNPNPTLHPPTSPSPMSPSSNPRPSPSAPVDHFEAPTCRICFESGGDLIIPCLCSGSSLHIHRGCLDDWRAVNMGKKPFSECSTCHFPYQYEPPPLPPADHTHATLRYRILVIRDIAIALIAITLILSLVAYVVSQLDDYAGGFILHHFPSIPPPLTFFLCAFVLSLACIGLFGLTAKACGLEDRLLRRDPLQEGGCEGCCLRCGTGDCCRYGGGWGRGVSRGGGEGAVLVFVLIVLVVLAVFGVFYGLLYGSVILERLTSRHIKRRWYRSAVEQYRVVDYTGRNDLLRSIARKVN